jgi:hypothetical protein
MKEGGYLIRSRVTIPRTGRLKEVRTQLPKAESAEAAYLDLQRRIEELRAADDLSMSIPSFAEYAKSLFARKIDKAEIKSAKSRERWESALTEHLVPRRRDGAQGADEEAFAEHRQRLALHPARHHQYRCG